jgi:tetratricopeptide (TPR) repeat protein
MTSHIYLAAGMWDEVVAANEQATRVAAERARNAGRTPGSCGHANMWLMYGYLQQGRQDDARRVLDGCRASATGVNGLAVRAAEQDPLDPDNIPAGSYIQMWSRYVIDTEAWSAPLAQEELPLGDLTGATVTRAFVRTLAAAKRANAAAFRAAKAEFENARRSLDAFLATRPSGRERYRARAAVLDREVEALALLLDKKPDEAVAALRTAAAAEAAMPVEFGPPFVDKPAAELLGDVLLGLGRKPEARTAYESALERAPNRVSIVAGLAHSQ